MPGARFLCTLRAELLHSCTSREYSAAQFSAFESVSARAMNPPPGNISLQSVITRQHFTHANSSALKGTNFRASRMAEICCAESASSFGNGDLFFIADRRNDAAQQVRREPRNVMFALRVARRANNHFIFVHAARYEFASGNNVATAQKLSHRTLPRQFEGPGRRLGLANSTLASGEYQKIRLS